MSLTDSSEPLLATCLIPGECIDTQSHVCMPYGSHNYALI